VSIKLSIDFIMDFEWPAENIVGHLVAYLVRHPGKVHSALRCGSPLPRLMWHIVAIQCQKIFCDKGNRKTRSIRSKTGYVSLS